MTKTKAAAPTVETKPTEVLNRQPNSIWIVNPVPVALDQAVVHIRNGMRFADLPVELFGGNISFYLEPGNPAQHSVDAAEKARVEWLAVEEAKRQKEIEAAAARMLEEKARADKQAELAKQIHDTENALRRLKYAHDHA